MDLVYSLGPSVAGMPTRPTHQRGTPTRTRRAGPRAPVARSGYTCRAADEPKDEESRDDAHRPGLRGGARPRGPAGALPRALLPTARHALLRRQLARPPLARRRGRRAARAGRVEGAGDRGLAARARALVLPGRG